MSTKKERIGVVGLGYVGLPVALGFARKYETVGFDISTGRVEALKRREDRTREASAAELAETTLVLTADPVDLRGCTFIVVAVPTPIDSHRRPDLTPVESASRTVGRILGKGAVVVYESTVYPGVTEEICGPILEAESGLKRGVDFFLGYSPERINPGDKEHRLDTIVKVVSGENAETLDRVADAYSAIVTAGVHRAPTIKVAEAAKVIENTQRDINIALMNELAVIFERLDIETRDVLAAAGTKWNFLRFSPGLVGGHCIGVDPYYLTARAEQADDALVRVLQHALDLGVDDGLLFGRRLGGGVVHRVVGEAEVGHRVVHDKAARQRRRLAHVHARARGDKGGAVDELLGGAAAHAHVDGGEHVLPRVVVLVARQRVGRAARKAARQNGHLVQWIAVWQHRGQNRMAAFVVGGGPLLFGRQDHALAQRAEHHSVAGVFEIDALDDL